MEVVKNYLNSVFLGTKVSFWCPTYSDHPYLWYCKTVALITAENSDFGSFKIYVLCYILER